MATPYPWNKTLKLSQNFFFNFTCYHRLNLGGNGTHLLCAYRLNHLATAAIPLNIHIIIIIIKLRFCRELVHCYRPKLLIILVNSPNGRVLVPRNIVYGAAPVEYRSEQSTLKLMSKTVFTWYSKIKKTTVIRSSYQSYNPTNLPIAPTHYA